LVNDCLYVHVDVELIIQLEPAEQEEESNVNVAEGPTSKLEHGLEGLTGDVVASGRAR